MDPSLKAHLQYLEEQLLQPEVRSSREALQRILAENFLSSGVLGACFTKMSRLVKRELGKWRWL
ncbi:Uncharacterized protein conserved in bacteria [Listeria newyorkensis]|nr:Uncharacterized protein conserved in bacteria [Listeria newyorkensis]